MNKKKDTISIGDITQHDRTRIDRSKDDVMLEGGAILKKRGPLTEATYYILLALQEPNHGYGMMQMIEQITDGEVEIGPGTLYGALGKLEKQGAIQAAVCPDSSDTRRKCYVLTDVGQELLVDEYERMKRVLANSEARIKGAKR